MDAVMAFDVGTTHLKWVVVEDASGLRLWDGRTRVSASQDGVVSEQNPEVILKAVRQALQDAGSYGHVQRVAFSAAMHSFVVVDPDGTALTNSWTWMDKRAQDAAQNLRASGKAEALRRLSGVPVHAMSPLVKWLSLLGTLPREARPVSLKDYLLYHLTGTWATDYSTAAASGFLGLDNQWLGEALQLAHLTRGELPSLWPMTHRLTPRDYPGDLVIGGNDGATAHLHLQIPADGTVAVLAMGTSGALRTTLHEPVDSPELFCYSLGPAEGYLVGSAFSNVGNVLDWLAHLFQVDIDTVLAEGLAAARSQRLLPLTLGYWFGERSPWWREDLAGAWLDLRPDHQRGDLMGAALLSMAAAYWHGLNTLRGAGAPVSEIRGGSGLLDIPAVAAWMADALGQDMVLHDERDASLLGAVDLARGRVNEAGRRGARYQPRDPQIHRRIVETWGRIAEWISSHP